MPGLRGHRAGGAPSGRLGQAGYWTRAVIASNQGLAPRDPTARTRTVRKLPTGRPVKLRLALTELMLGRVSKTTGALPSAVSAWISS